MGGCANREAVVADVNPALQVNGARYNIDSSEMVRRLTTGTEVTRVSSRRRNVDEVMEARPSSSALGNNHVRSSRISGKLGKARSTRRMSRMGSFARAEFIDGVKGMAETKGNCGRTPTLDGRLARFGMQMKEMEGDGNCQFRSFAYNLFGMQAHHSITRKAAVAHMEKNKDFFSIFFETQKEFKAYLNDMRRSRTWGDELTLRAIVEAYGCEVHVITSEPANWYLVYEPECHPERLDPAVAICPKGLPLPSPRKQVFLSYISPIHYNSIVACGRE